MKEMHSSQIAMDMSWAETMYNPDAHFVSYGFGWAFHDYRGEKIDEHLGGGMNSIVALAPEENLGIAICTNASYENFESLRMIRRNKAYGFRPLYRKTI